jgi:GT2 family glycosyltransferase
LSNYGGSSSHICEQRLAVTVVIPTIGRPELLRRALESVSACVPRAAEILVIDQSTGDDVVATVAEFAPAGAVRIASCGRGPALAINEGLSAARHDVVLATHDDCTVAADWVGVGWQLASEDPSAIFTGRVIPVGDPDPDAVPSAKDDPVPRDYTGEAECGVLFPASMVLPRAEVLSFGGLDERFSVSAEDNDLCYRWLTAGRRLRYEPRLRVWHHGWRTPLELQRLYARYSYGQGQLYAKHLRTGDLRMLRFIARDARYILGFFRALLIASASDRTRWRTVGAPHVRLRPLISGLLSEWRTPR